MRLLLATTNPNKIREIRAMLDGVDVEIVGLDAFPAIAAPDETGATFADNARLKARYYSAATGMPAIAEDSGLEVDALDGAPGIESARFAGTETSYPEKFVVLYRMLAALSRSPRATTSCSRPAAPSKAVSRLSRGAPTASATTRFSTTHPKAARWARSATT